MNRNPYEERYRAKIEAKRRRFVSLTRTVNQDGTHTIYAICEKVRAWWRLAVGNDEAPEGWTVLFHPPEAGQ